MYASAADVTAERPAARTRRNSKTLLPGRSPYF